MSSTPDASKPQVASRQCGGATWGASQRLRGKQAVVNESGLDRLRQNGRHLHTSCTRPVCPGRCATPHSVAPVNLSVTMHDGRLQLWVTFEFMTL